MLRPSSTSSASSTRCGGTPPGRASFATKYVDEGLLGYDPQGATRVRMSLMPAAVARRVDVRTAAEQLLWTPEWQEQKRFEQGGVKVRYRTGLKGQLVRQLLALLALLAERLPYCRVRYAF